MRKILFIALLLAPFVASAQHPFKGDQHFEGKATGQTATTSDGFTILSQVEDLVTAGTSGKLDKSALRDSLSAGSLSISRTLKIVDSVFGVNTDTMATRDYVDSVAGTVGSGSGISEIGQGWGLSKVNDSTNRVDTAAVASANALNAGLAGKVARADSGDTYVTPTGLSAAIEAIPTAAALPDVPVSSLTGTSYTAALTDKNKIIVITNGSAITVTIPPNSSVAFPVGTVLEYSQGGTGSITFSAGAGVTVGNAHSYTKTSGQYAIVALRKIATNTWVLFGDLQ